MAEFAANNNNFAFTRLFLFSASKSLYLYMSYDIIELSNITICKWINKKKAIHISNLIQLIWKYVQKSINQTKQIDIKKKFFMILEIKYDYLQKILVLINYPQS